MEDVHNSQSKKRKRRFSKKLQVDEMVEVRSMELGFQGSWHPGKIIQCEKLKRHVRYNNLLDDDGVNYLVEVVNVSETLEDGIECDDLYVRGLIRPVPPWIDFERGDLNFGLCVDVNYQEAWWEGVIFDNCDGMENRSVFFPDFGDEIQVGIHQLRITQDWDEVTDEWMRRGNWVFLDLIEEQERKLLVAVSAKQIWYDLQIKREFKMIKEWTFNVKYLWRDMVVEIVNDYLSLTVKEILSILNPSDNIQNPDIFPPTVSSSVVNEEVEDVPEFCPEAMAGVDLSMSLPDKEIVVQKVPLVKEISPNGDCEVVSGASCLEENREDRFSTDSNWKPLKLSEGELCPDAVEEYLLASDRETRAFWKDKLQKHLICLGWKIEWTDKYKSKRYRYNVPDKQGQKFYLSLLEVCRVMKKDKMHPTVDCHPSDQPLNPSDNIQNPYIFPPTVPSSVVNEEVEDVPEFCPEAVEQYYNSYITNKSRAFKKKWILKAKRHLLAEGWIFDYPPPTNKKRGIIYISPEDRRFPTLHAACKFCMEKGISKLATSDMRPLNVLGKNEVNVDQVSIGELPKGSELQAMDGIVASRSTAHKKRKRVRDSKVNTSTCQRNGKPLRVLRLNKRVQKVSAPSLLHPKPLNVLSCLIDKRIILSRSKVYYKSKGRYVQTLAEGKITRDGIKCNCCLAIYSFVGFENHASGSSTCRPSASIFLEDGKSLLDCQIEMMQRHMTRETSGKSFSDLSLSDYICSVCHYGGKLILCDKCPSSFHKTCLGLEDIPAGDWFCPSCRCGICGQWKIDGNEIGHFLTCVQCEHKYHVRCLENGASDKSIYLGNWFCGKECEKIYDGLHKLLGEPVSVGVDNLTWTLVKFINPDSCDPGSIRNDLLAESCIKLNLALSVMHECFKPLKEYFTGRDLMEDVIFSRWSELNRLNFQGFYIVILERDEELISAATVRVHGKKVAEVPLVGTRLQYRRHGMCRILIRELEKVICKRYICLSSFALTGGLFLPGISGFVMLVDADASNLERDLDGVLNDILLFYKLSDIGILCLYNLSIVTSDVFAMVFIQELIQLGVERLVLPAVPSVLETWTGSFGFAKMTDFERSQFLDYTFLDFQDTIMCQKLLIRQSPDSVLLRESQPKGDIFSGSCCANFSKSSVCEVYQVEEIDETGMVDEQIKETSVAIKALISGSNEDHVIGALESLTLVQRPSPGDQQRQNGTTSSECSNDKLVDRNNDDMCKLFYSPKKVSKTCEGLAFHGELALQGFELAEYKKDD
ncbi:hypothetical protein VNO78_27883 [Psophocarpus tetragonolobus]|uniref:PHD-type domain-containing protein n=1 Tax=Psophocarpus tetragonolobus TaxID=3891 RepID=A0AAN9S3F3_PSOTE